MKTILKQTSWLFLAQSTTRVIGFFYTIYLARNLGVDNFGLFTAALAYFSLVSSFADFGFNRFLIREIAKDHTKSSELIWNVSMFRLFFTSIIFAFVAILMYALDPDKMRVGLTLLAVLAVLPLSIAQTFDGIFIARQKLQFSAIAFLTSSIATFLIGIVLVSKGFGAIGAINALIFGQLAYLIALIIFLWIYQRPSLSDIKFSTLKKIAQDSFPYGLLSVLGLLYFRVDTLMLSYMKGNFETGIYGAAYRFLEAIIFVPASLSTALFPIMVNFLEKNPKKIYGLYLKVTAFLFAISLVVLLFYLTLLPIIIINFLPNFSESVRVIKILSLTIPFMFMISPQGILLMSAKRFLKPLILMSLFNLIINIVLNLLLIPKYGYIGAAWMTVISDIIGFLIFFFYIRHEIS